MPAGPNQRWERLRGIAKEGGGGIIIIIIVILIVITMVGGKDTTSLPQVPINHGSEEMDCRSAAGRPLGAASPSALAANPMIQPLTVAQIRVSPTVSMNHHLRSGSRQHRTEFLSYSS